MMFSNVIIVTFSVFVVASIGLASLWIYECAKHIQDEYKNYDYTEDTDR